MAEFDSSSDIASLSAGEALDRKLSQQALDLVHGAH